MVTKKLNHKKVKKLKHTKKEMADYLEPNYHSIKMSDARLLFQLKTKMVPVKVNDASSFRENLNCILCGNEGRIKKDTQNIS